MQDKQKAVDEFITEEITGRGTSIVEYLKVGLARLVEEIYKDELAIADARWKKAEQELARVYDSNL